MNNVRHKQMNYQEIKYSPMLCAKQINLKNVSWHLYKINCIFMPPYTLRTDFSNFGLFWLSTICIHFMLFWRKKIFKYPPSPSLIVIAYLSHDFDFLKVRVFKQYTSLTNSLIASAFFWTDHVAQMPIRNKKKIKAASCKMTHFTPLHLGHTNRGNLSKLTNYQRACWQSSNVYCV